MNRERPRPLAFVGSRVAEAAFDLRSRWRAVWWLWCAVGLVMGLVPFVDRNALQISSLASGLYIVLAAVGLNYAVGLAGIPSLGQGGFVGIGAFVAGWLAARWGWDLVAATAAGTAAAAIAGFAVGAGAARLTRVYIAITTWIVAWMLQFALTDFPQISGGSQGLALPPARITVLGASARFTPLWHYWTALVLISLALVMYAAAKRMPAGIHLTALRQGEAGALVLGADRAMLRTGAVVASAAIGGLAGALAVQLYQIADPTSYGPLLSVKLFVAVMIGGASVTAGPVVGAATLALIGPVAHGLGNLAGLAPERFEPLVAAALLVAALAVGGEGILPRLASLLGPRDEPAPATRPPRLSSPARSTTSEPAPVALEALGLSKSFGGVRALDSVDLTVRAGSVHAVIGPNGSGKSTLLKILSGSLHADAGALRVGDEEVRAGSVADLRARGIARTLQRTVVFDDMSVRDHVLAGGVTEGKAGTLRRLAATPAARVDAQRALGDAHAILSDLGLEDAVNLPANRLSGAQQRLLMIAMALAAHPKVALLDEPGAGMSAEHLDFMVQVIGALSSAGIAVVLVEHNLRVVRSTASEVTVLSSGRVIARGTPTEVAASDEVRSAYMGATSL